MCLCISCGSAQQTVGSGSPEDQMHARRMDSLQVPTVSSVDVGFAYECYTNPRGQSFCWDEAVSIAPFGISSERNSACPTLIPLIGATRIAVGGYHACALTLTSKVFCWGRNDEGELGFRSPSASAEPRPVPGLSTTSWLCADQGLSCAIDTSGLLRCWGSCSYGRCGRISRCSHDQCTPRTTSARLILPDRLVTQCVVTARNVCALTVGGEVLCWGDNHSDQLGYLATVLNPRLSPVAQPMSSSAVRVVASDDAVCSLLRSGEVVCSGVWPRLRRLHPELAGLRGVRVLGPDPLLADICMGDNFLCALSRSQQLQCWELPLWTIGSSPQQLTESSVILSAESVGRFSCRYDRLCVVRRDESFRCFHPLSKHRSTERCDPFSGWTQIR